MWCNRTLPLLPIPTRQCHSFGGVPIWQEKQENEPDKGGVAENTRQPAAPVTCEVVPYGRGMVCSQVALPDTTPQLHGDNWRNGKPIIGYFFEMEAPNRRLADRDAKATNDIRKRTINQHFHHSLYPWRLIEHMSKNFSNAELTRTKGPLTSGKAIGRKRSSGHVTLTSWRKMARESMRHTLSPTNR
jgi:hypothetical protein